MRPRGITRGNTPPPLTDSPAASTPGFNEAAGYYPRKPVEDVMDEQRPIGFNEAAGYYPRKQTRN